MRLEPEPPKELTKPLDIDDDVAMLDEQEQEELLNSIKTSRIVVPILIGVGVVFYLAFRNFNVEDFTAINWTLHTLFFIGVALVLQVIRHFIYVYRLRLLSNGHFAWKKCIELIFIWEFSSSISPTSVGGSLVALFALSQENYGAGRTAALVVYVMVLDTLFFITTLPILLALLGPDIVFVGNPGIFHMSYWQNSLIITAYLTMLGYGSLLLLGLFYKPQLINSFLIAVTSLPLIKKLRRGAERLGAQLILASSEMKSRGWAFHAKAFLSTAAAWSVRFLVLQVLVMAFMVEIDITQFNLFGRLEAMYIVMAFSPTPGSAGVAEGLFNNFLGDVVITDTGKYNASLGIIIAVIWRLLSYYSYLFAGAIIVPNWLKNLINNRKRKNQVKEEALQSDSQEQ